MFSERIDLVLLQNETLFYAVIGIIANTASVKPFCCCANCV